MWPCFWVWLNYLIADFPSMSRELPVCKLELGVLCGMTFSIVYFPCYLVAPFTLLPTRMTFHLGSDGISY